MKNSDELIQLKITYDKNLEEIEIFLEIDKTYEDMGLDEFQKEINGMSTLNWTKIIRAVA